MKASTFPSVPFVLACCLLASFALVGTGVAQIQQPTDVLYPLHHDVSLPLAELARNVPPLEIPSGPIREIPNREYPYESTPLREVTDHVLQNYFGTAEAPMTIANFEGINNLCNCYPPDPNGAAGPNHFMQTVNTHFAVYDKAGTILFGPSLLSVLWDGIPGPWAGRNDGDPVVLYDRYSDRWVVIQFSLPSTYYVLFAVSTSSDPLGTYYRYIFEFTPFPDYPKIAVWHDAYYMSFAAFDPGYIGPAAVAVDRNAMLSGDPAAMIMFQRTSADPYLLPSDADGTLPPTGTPNYFAGIDLGSQNVRIYEMAVNWATPASSTFTDVATLPASPFVAPVCTTRNCLPQPGTTVGLDALSNRLLFRLQWRDFGTHQAMVANHTVKIGSGIQAGVRWYELRRSGGPWSIYQQGTYAPDGDSRWMASIAMDKFGNIGLGYSVTSSTVFPSIRFTGRRASDPLGVMTIAETTIVAGTGVQTGTAYRWGDYTSMHLDPTDDWTMWYTNEYIQTTGSAPWRTRIASFRLTPAVPPPADIDVTPTSLTFTVPEGGAGGDVLGIANVAPPGSQDLNWSIFEQELPIASGDGRTVPVRYSTSATNSHTSPLPANPGEPSVGTRSGTQMAYSHIPVGNPSEKVMAKGEFAVDLRSGQAGKSESVPATPGPECSTGLIYDDGTVENGYAWLSTVTDGMIVSRFDPPYYPYSFGQVCINWTQLASDPTLNFNIVVFDDDGAGGAPGTLLASIPSSANGVPNWPLFSFYDYDVAGLIPSVTSGSVYIGAQWNPSIEGVFYICADESPDTPYHLGYGYNDIDGVWETCDNIWGSAYEAMFIRADAAAVDIPWLSENPTNGTIPAGSNQNVDVTVDATGLTAGTYNCNLVVSSNDPANPQIAVPVTLNVVPGGPPPEEFAIIANSSDRSIHIIDVATNTIKGPFLGGSLGSGQLLDPVITPDGQTALISNFEDQAVYFLDVSNANTPAVLDSVDIGFPAEDIDLTPDGAFALVTDGGGGSLIAVVDVSAMSLIQTLDISPRDAQAVAIGRDGTVLLADALNNQVHVLLTNLSTGLLTDPATAISVDLAPINIAISPDGQTALVANFSSSSVNVLQITAPGSVTLTGSVPNLLGVQSIAFEANGTRAFAVQTGTTPDELAVLSVTAPGNVIDTGVRVSLLTDASGGYLGVDVIDVSADGNWAYVGNPTLSSIITDVAVVDLNSYTLSTSLTAGNYPAGIAIGGAGAPIVPLLADLTVEDNCANSQLLTFGTAPGATEGFDPGLDILAPPPPPVGAFDARLRTAFDDFLKDIRATNTNTTTWDVHFAPASGCTPATLSWHPGQLPSDGSVRLQDPFDGSLANVNMRVESTYVDVLALGHLKIVYSLTTDFTKDVATGWNLLSLPNDPPDKYYLTLFPTAIPGTLFGFNGSYNATDSLKLTRGYWLRFPSATSATITGFPGYLVTDTLASGWNLVGGPSCDVLVSSVSDPGGIVIPGTWFGFNGSYLPADTIKQGNGYWVRASAPGVITMDCGVLAPHIAKHATPSLDLSRYASLEISDATGASQSLYCGVELADPEAKVSFSLPPVPPAGVFDVRFAGDYRIAPAGEATIEVQATAYPLTIRCANIPESEDVQYVLQEIAGTEAGARHSLRSGASIQIQNPEVKQLQLLARGKEVPTVFALEQNHPNPFNPTTQIRYAIPRDVHVTIRVYNTLGQLVKTLLSEDAKAGRYMVPWNADNDAGQTVGSGIYFYRVDAGEFSDTKKMVLLR